MNSKISGIVGLSAPELRVDLWVDESGQGRPAVQIGQFPNKIKVIYCFQAWCAGCHSLGFPALKKMVDILAEKGHIQFLAVQTVFEGYEANTFEKMLEIQEKYTLPIPFGHDPGHVDTRLTSTTMLDYRTGGTPWFIFIDRENRVLFNDFHLDVEHAILYLEELSNKS